RRHEIIDELKNTYQDKCAQIGTHSTIGLKQAMQDASRALYEKVLPEIYVINKRIKPPPQGVNTHSWLYGYTDEDGNEVPGFLESRPDLSKFFISKPKFKELVEKLIGITRQMGRHAGGFCFAEKPIYEYIPTAFIGNKLETFHVTQYSKDWVEKAGLIK